MSISRIITICFVVLAMLLAGQTIYASLPAQPDRFFDVVSLDTMKLSRDGARNPDVTKEIPQLVAQLEKLHPTHVAIGTPYNEEFVPLMQKWTSEIHMRGMSVWFRGNFSQWEDWFDYGRMQHPQDHIQLTYNYIVAHPELFRDGDIFTPVPEPENGGFGDPRFSEESKKKFFDFLPKSYTKCQEAFKKIRKNVTCGYYSVNGDVAKLFTREDVQKIGNVLAIDHYVQTPERLIEDARALHETTGADIILGEYGAPIPDIHGDLNEEEQAALIERNMLAIAENRSFIRGINYWTTFGGSTRVFESINKPKKAAAVLKKYYKPVAVKGSVIDAFGLPIKGAQVQIQPFSSEITNTFGTYQLLTTEDHLRLTASMPGYKAVTKTVVVSKDHTASISLQLEPQRPGILYTLRLLLTRAAQIFR